MLFNLLSKKTKTVDTYQADIRKLVKEFRLAFANYTDQGYRLALEQIDECLNTISKENISDLKIALRVKWMIKEIGMMLFDHYFELTPEEDKLFWAIKDLNGKHDNIGHGVGIGL